MPRSSTPPTCSTQRASRWRISTAPASPTSSTSAATGFACYANQAGNAWGDPVRCPRRRTWTSSADMRVIDLLGQGTACLTWSTPGPVSGAGDPLHRPDGRAEAAPAREPAEQPRRRNPAPVRVVHVVRPGRPAGRPAVADPAAFPVHVLERIETIDHIAGNRFVTRYAYHHGYFDGHEREFRGFGLVEQFDTEAFAAAPGQRRRPTWRRSSRCRRC